MVIFNLHFRHYTLIALIIVMSLPVIGCKSLPTVRSDLKSDGHSPSENESHLTIKLLTEQSIPQSQLEPQYITSYTEVDNRLLTRLTQEFVSKLTELNKASKIAFLHNATISRDLQFSMATLSSPTKVTDLTFDSDSGTLQWSYVNVGDYDLSGEVGVPDIWPIALNYGKAVFYNEGGDPEEDIGTPEGLDNIRLAWIDGDNNGEIGVSDVTPIAVNYLSNITAYQILTSDTIDGEYEVIAEVDISFASQEFPIIFRDIALPSSTKEYIVIRPILHSTTYGELSNAVHITNRRPIAVISLSPETPYAPVLAEFDASASFDHDGYIVTYEWDMDGDGEYELNNGNNSILTYRFHAWGEYSISLKVTDDEGAEGTTSSSLEVSPPRFIMDYISDSTGYIQLALDYEYKPHLSYYLYGDPIFQVFYAHKEAEVFKEELLTTEQYIQDQSFCLYQDTTPVIAYSYYDPISESHLALVYYLTDGGWVSYSLAEYGHCTSLTLTTSPNGNVLLLAAFKNDETINMLQSIYTAAGWDSEIVYSVDGTYEYRDMSAAATSDSEYYVVYINYPDSSGAARSLECAYYDGQSYSYEKLNLSSIIQSASIVLNKENHPAIILVGSEPLLLSIATKSNGTWDYDNVLSSQYVWRGSASLVYDSYNHPYVLFYGEDHLILATKKDGAWIDCSIHKAYGIPLECETQLIIQEDSAFHIAFTDRYTLYEAKIYYSKSY